jgi:hypothetical protein
MKTAFTKHHLAFFLAFTVVLCATPAIAQQTFTFTNAGQSGRLGPTQTQVNTAYASTNLSGAVGAINGIQTWTVPYTGPFRITAVGAQGGSGTTYNGGLGSSVRGDFTLTAGSILNIIVGQQGEYNSNGYNTGGGGGSFVWITGQPQPFVAAGGGGGAGYGAGGVNSSTTTSGTAGTGGGTGGSGGNGANPGGGGWLSSGGNFLPSYTLCNVKCSGNQAGLVVGGASPTTSIVYHGCSGTSDTGDGGFGGGSGASGECATNNGAGGGGGYSGGAGQTGATTGGGGGGSYNGGVNQVNVAGTNAGNGRVIIEELCNITVSASSVPNPTAPVICSGQSVTLTTNAASNYSWSTGVTGTNQIVVAPTSNTVITVSGTSSASCNASRNITITVSPGPPVVSLSTSTTSVCLGNSVAITASGALTYTFTGGIAQGVPFVPSQTTTYSVTGQNGCGVHTASVTINVSALPVFAITSPTIVCANSSATLTAGGAQSFTWFPGPVVGNPIVQSPAVNTVYSVTGQSGGCIGQATVMLTTKPVPTIGIAASSTAICEGEAVILTLSGASSYTWTNSNLSGTTATVSPNAPTAFNVSGTNSLGCSSASQQITIVYPKPLVSASASPTLICAGASVTLSASGADSYSWSHGPGTVVSPVTTTTYVVTGTESTHGCTAAVSVPVNVYQATISVSQNTSICPGGSVVISAGPATSYTWMHGGSSASSTVSPASATIYTINATGTVNNMTCIRTNTVQVGVFPPAVVTASAHRTSICRNETTTLTASGGNTYLWNTGSTSSVVVITGLVPGPLHYTVTGTDQNQCKAAHSLTVNVSNCTGLSESGSTGGSIKVYPNPNSGVFTIEAAPGATIQITNALGEVVRRLTVDQAQAIITVSDLPKGVYMLSLNNDTAQSTRVIIE